MNKQLTNTGIKTAGIFGMENAFDFNPVKGCKNEECHLHPVNTGECWAAKMSYRMAGPWAKSEIKYKGIIETKKCKCTTWYQKLKEFKPVWLWSQYRKEFPKERSCILVGYMTDIAHINREWVQKIIDKINANNDERKAAGLLLHVFPFLTKDPSIYHKFKWPDNCWLGFTAIDEARFIKCAKCFAERECENLIYAYLEPLQSDIGILFNGQYKNAWEPDWVIVGGGSTPLHPDWVRSIRDQCQAAGIPYYFKGWGKWLPVFDIESSDLLYYEKKVKGDCPNLLDADEIWEQFPEVK